MSAASVQSPHLSDLICSSLGRNSISVSSSLSDLVGSPYDVSSDAVLSIEDLRAQMGTCFTCGVMWTQDHVSLDCSECGGYSLERPCMLCDGKCGQSWKRDFNMSHACGKARWQGICPKYPTPVLTIQSVPNTNTNINNNNNSTTNSCSNLSTSFTNQIQSTPSTCHHANQQFLQQELCIRLEKLTTKAQT
uniref:Protein pinocchio n=1 Tax=Corethrella appendiculata TaxID=1370023 RepID=U5ECU8_9DIPT